MNMKLVRTVKLKLNIPVESIKPTLDAYTNVNIAVSLLMLILMLAGISGKITWTLHAIQVAAQSIAVS